MLVASSIITCPNDSDRLGSGEFDMPAVRTAYRIERLPSNTTLETVLQQLTWDPAKHLEVKAKSIGPVDDGNAHSPKVATVYFNFRDNNNDELPLLGGRGGVILDKNFFGFTPLNTPVSPIIADIIAVTGLAGNAFGSWASDIEHMWLRDMLAKDFPNARIMIYGYDSHLKDSTSFSDLSGFSKPFAEGLIRVRRHDTKRPLILIGHSLGGLIVEKALLWLDQKRICPSISLLIFFGVPHRGLNNEALKKLVTNNPTENLVNQIGFGSPAVLELQERFSQFVSHNNTPILSIYEQKLTNSTIEHADGSWKRDGDRIQMVPESSAVLGVGKLERKIPSQTDHSKLAKLNPSSESTYLDVKAGIEEALGPTPLRYQQLIQAIKDHDLDKTRDLVLSSKFDLNVQDENGDLPISLVAKWSSIDAMKLLLEFGANPNCQDSANWTALARAVKQSNASLDLVTLLLESKARINDPSGPQGCPALHCAAAQPTNFKVVQKLLEAEANIENKDHDGRTALYIASRQNCNFNVGVLLDSNHINVNSSNWNMNDKKHGETPLMGAAYCDGASQNNLEVLRLLVTRGATVNAQTKRGRTALMIASSRGNYQGVQYLLDNGAKTEFRDNDNGFSALIYAAKAGRVDVTKKLVDQGNADIKPKCKGGWRALDWAHHHGHVDVVEYLLTVGRNYRPKSQFADAVGVDRRREMDELLQKIKTGGIRGWRRGH